MKKLVHALHLTLVVASFTLFVASCHKGDEDFGKRRVTPISREEGSGTRDAFVELFDIRQDSSASQSLDMISDEADVTNSSEVMLSAVAGGKGAVGYVSLGALSGAVKAIRIDGVYPSVANIKKGSYKMSRPFNVVTRQDAQEAAADFIRYILSSDGQAVVEKAGYIAFASNPRYVATGKRGKVSVVGSSSVAPLMQKLAREYQRLSPDVNVEVHLSDSTTGIRSVISGLCDIGMMSRGLTASERDQGVRQTTIATDGIVVIVNKANPIDELTSESVRRLFSGEAGTWGEVL